MFESSVKSDVLIAKADNILVLIGEYRTKRFNSIPKSVLSKIRYFYNARSVGRPKPGITFDWTQVLNIEEHIKRHSNTLVLVAEEGSAKVAKIASRLNDIGGSKIQVDHVSFYDSTDVDVSYLEALGVSAYRTIDRNSIFLHGKNSGKIIIRCGQRGVSTENVTVLDCISVDKRLLIINVGKGGKVSLGCGTTVVEATLTVNTEGAIYVGEDCMIANRVEVNQSDSHHIFDKVSGLRVNESRDIAIGNHVWLGREAMLLAGCVIGSGSVVGARSVTSSTFGDNLILAGNPAKVIREGIVWSRDLIKLGHKNHISECLDQGALRYY